MKDEEYQRMVLKNINSKFSESEVINLLSKKLKQIECELGIVKSERDEAIFNFESEKKTRKKQERT